MARVTISFNGTSIQTANIKTQEIEHESISGKKLDIQGLDGRDGGKLLNVTFAPRVIRLRGNLSYTTQALLEAGIDDFKALLNQPNKHLDIGYAGGTRRYTCDMASVTVIRRFYNVTFCDWEAEFVVSNKPFGSVLDTTSAEYTIKSIATSWGSFVASGNYSPKPKITITFSEATTITDLRVRNKTTGDWILVTSPNGASGFGITDVVVIDCDQVLCTVNGVNVDYRGVFPLFQAGGNDMRFSFIGGLHYKCTIQIVYYPLYL